MTNEEAIEDIEKNIKPIIDGKSLELAIKSLKQNSVIKGELKSEREWRFNTRVEMLDKKAEIEILLEENTKLKAEIERLNGKSEMYRDMADSFCNSNIKLKAKIEQLKENYDTLAKQYSNVENSSIRYYNELKKLKAAQP